MFEALGKLILLSTLALVRRIRKFLRISDKKRSAFVVTESQLIYTYAAHLNCDVVDHYQVASELVRLGFAELAFSPEGEYVWSLGDELQSEHRRTIDDAAAGRTKIFLAENLPENYIEYVLRGNALASAERQLFGTNEVPHSYTRFFLSELYIWIDEHSEPLRLILDLKIFSSGVLLLSFLVREEKRWDLVDFIDDRVNLAMKAVERLAFERNLCLLLYERFFADSDEARTLTKEERTRLRVNLADQVDSKRQFLMFEGDEQTTLNEIGSDVLNVLAYCLDKPVLKTGCRLHGTEEPIRIPGVWRGTPHVHLLGFSGQSSSARVNINRSMSEFHKILLRTSEDLSGSLEIPELPVNLRRYFDDHAVFVNEATVLWVYGPAVEECEVAGQIHRPLDHNQAKGEILESVAMTYRTLADRAVGSKSLWEEVLDLWTVFTDVEDLLATIGNFGEIREFVEYSLQVRRTDRSREIFMLAMQLRERTASVIEARKLSVLGAIFTIAVGIFSVPVVSKHLQENLFESLYPHLSDSMTLMLGYVCSISFFVFAMSLGVWIWRRRRWIDLK